MSAPTGDRQRAAVRRALAPGRRLDGIPRAGAAESPWDDERRFYQPRFPSAADVVKTAKGMRAAHSPGRWDGHEGAVAQLVISPGTVGVRYRNYARHERTAARGRRAHVVRVDQDAAQLVRDGHFPEPPPVRQVIREWSRKSRTNMWSAFHQVDYQPFFKRGRVPAMVTLTYQGDWLAVAPSGKASKRHLQALRKAYWRAWGEKLVAIWKLEFQDRGAPHYHLMMVPPHGRAKAGLHAGKTFKQWLGDTWASILRHPDPEHRERGRRAGTRIDFADGMRATDPTRVATYFAKHGSFKAKEYQHQVPPEWQQPGAGPGRFWGYWNLRRVAIGVEVAHEDAVRVARTLRRWAAARGITQQRAVMRYPSGLLRPAGDVESMGPTGLQELAAQKPPKIRSVRRPVKRMRGKFGAGWVATNCGTALASALSRYLAIIHAPT